MEKLLVTGVAADKDTVRISVIGLEDKPGTAFAVFNTLAANNINVDIILQSVGREGTKDISFTVASDDLEHAILTRFLGDRPDFSHYADFPVERTAYKVGYNSGYYLERKSCKTFNRRCGNDEQSRSSCENV